MIPWHRSLVVVLVLAATPCAWADIGAWYCGENASQFTSRTGATRATQPYPSDGTHSGSYTSGSVTISGALGSTINFSNWTDAIPLDQAGPDLAFNGDENFDLDFAAPIYSLGIEYDHSNSEMPKFVVTFWLDQQQIGADEFWLARTIYGSNDYNCYGWWLDRPFNHVEFREQDTDALNEYFGPIYSGTRAPPPKLIPPQSGAQVGYSVAAAGNVLAVGSRGHAVDMFHIGGPGQLPSPITHVSLQSSTVDTANDLDMDGTTIAIGNSGPDTLDPGSVLVANQDVQGLYTNVVTIPTPSSFYLGFGGSVALDDPYLVVGAPMTTSGDGLVTDVGYAFVYQRTSGGWQLMASLPPPVQDQPVEFGHDVEIQGDDLFVSANNATLAPGLPAPIYLYRRSGQQWLANGEIDVSAGPSGYPYASRLSVENDVLAATIPLYGAPDLNTLLATAIYRRSGDTWTLDDTVFPHDATYSTVRNSVVVFGGHVFTGEPAPFDTTAQLDGTTCLEEYARDPDSGRWNGIADWSHPLTLSTDLCGNGIAVTDRFVFGGSPQDNLGSIIGYELESDPGNGSVTVTQRSIFWDGFDSE
ncbi:MAG: hypothetical protein WB784_10735 [Rhodanobacteraceae bacterium]